VGRVKQLLGQRGEAIAAGFLRLRGYRILARNYRSPAGELDLVARQGDTVVFVEVKTRRTRTFGPPELAVDRHKQRTLTRVAQHYLLQHRLHGVSCRFDVVTVDMGGVLPRVHHIPGAFDALEG